MLSLDILLGVFCSYLFAASLLKSDAPSLVPVILCIAVWLLYTLDHLADAHHLGERAIKPVYKCWYTFFPRHCLHSGKGISTRKYGWD